MTDTPEKVRVRIHRPGSPATASCPYGDALGDAWPDEPWAVGVLFVRADLHAAAVARAEKAEAELAQMAHQWNAMQDYVEGLHRRLGIDAPDAWAEAFKQEATK